MALLKGDLSNLHEIFPNLPHKMVKFRYREGLANGLLGARSGPWFCGGCNILLTECQCHERGYN